MSFPFKQQTMSKYSTPHSFSATKAEEMNS